MTRLGTTMVTRSSGRTRCCDRDRIGERRDQIFQPVCVMQTNHSVNVAIDRLQDNLAKRSTKVRPAHHRLSGSLLEAVENRTYQRIEPVTRIVVVPGGGAVSIARSPMATLLPDGLN